MVNSALERPALGLSVLGAGKQERPHPCPCGKRMGPCTWSCVSDGRTIPAVGENTEEPQTARDRATPPDASVAVPPRGPCFPGRLNPGLVNHPPRQEAASRWFVGDLGFHGRPVSPSSDGGQAQPAMLGPKTPRSAHSSQKRTRRKSIQGFSVSLHLYKGEGDRAANTGMADVMVPLHMANRNEVVSEEL